MNPLRAIQELVALKNEATAPAVLHPTAAHDAWKAKVEVVLIASLGEASSVLRDFREVSYTVGAWSGVGGEFERDMEYFRGGVARAVGIIDAAIYNLTLLGESGQRSSRLGSTGTTPIKDESSTVFLVHGHDNEAKHHAARVLQQLTGIEPTILHELPSGGLTVIEKLDTYAGPAAAAVVLLTPDDVGGPVDATPVPRTRQNVVFELGFFIGKLGRGNVIALVKGGIEIPSDMSGVVYINMDLASWPSEVARELDHIDGLGVNVRNLRS